MRQTLIRTLVVAALLTPLPALAQTVRGELVDPARLGIPGARVLLLDESGRTVASARTGEDGSFVLRAPAGGRFTVRAERPGYRSATSAPLVVGVGETATTSLVSDQPVMLEGISVAVSSRCEVRPGEGQRSAVVWEEARKALDAARKTFAARDYRFRTRAYTRDVDPESNVVTRDSTVGRRWWWSGRTWRSRWRPSPGTASWSSAATPWSTTSPTPRSSSPTPSWTRTASAPSPPTPSGRGWWGWRSSRCARAKGRT